MNQADEKTLLDIARARLENRHGAYERFEYALCRDPMSYLRALCTYGIEGALDSVLPPEYAAAHKHKRMIEFVDQWAAKQPASRPLTVEALPPLPQSAPAVTAAPATVTTLRNLKGNSGQPQGAGPALTKTQELRQAERWQLCIDKGLTMPTDTYAQLPRGIGTVARELGITRQALAQDLKAHRERIFSK